VNLAYFAIPFYIAMLALEVVVARLQQRDSYEKRDAFASLAMGVGSVLLGMLWGGVALAVYYALYEVTPLRLGHGPFAWAFALLADDFQYYWFHRTHHEIRLLWAAHVTHHSSQRYNFATALRQSWIPMTTLPFQAPLALLGIDPLMIVTVHGINLIYQFWIHTETIDRLGPLEAVFNTPSHHRVHHASNPIYLDRNYGGILIVWDRLFGTFEPEREKPIFGLTKNIRSYNPLYIAYHEAFAVLRDALRPNPLAVRLGYLLKPPGWSPDGSTRTADQMRAALRAADPAKETAAA
jgi:sterol desaturase/sphingolipid hydroxylase (fatty acid hydroxylase superfamily)